MNMIMRVSTLKLTEQSTEKERCVTKHYPVQGEHSNAHKNTTYVHGGNTNWVSCRNLVLSLREDNNIIILHTQLVGLSTSQCEIIFCMHFCRFTKWEEQSAQ